ncbi:MAG: type II toxin-antitoxin system VapC family toxin [Bacteroidales bacterium]|nr:type II toxin-antitoxin system VapC family toxin [Bacteroidales bacterium]
MSKVHKIVSVYLDTNVLMNYCSQQNEEIKIAKYLTDVRYENNLYISALSVAQTVSLIQSRKKKSKEEKRLEIDRLQEFVKKFTIISLTEKEIANSFEMYKSHSDFVDIEDVIQYSIARKVKCDAIITHNKSDFAAFVGNDVKIIDAYLSLIKRNIT